MLLIFLGSTITASAQLLGGMPIHKKAGGCANQGTLASQDFDCDGIINSIDLDDDNDGIVDTEEQGFTSTQTAASKAGVLVTMPSNVSYGLHPFHSPSATLQVLVDGDASFYGIAFSGTYVSQEFLRLEFPTPKCITSFTYNGLLNGFMAGGSEYKVQGSNDASTWDEVSPWLIWPSSSNFTHNFASNSKAYKYYRIYAGYVTPVNGCDLSEISFNEKATLTTLDTDNDGKINSFDIDADADGCSDAIEGAALIVAADVSPTGSLLGSVSSTGVPTKVGFGQLKNYSQNNTVNTCTAVDTDNDQIADVEDTDDDNDGIPDVDEAVNTTIVTLETHTSFGLTSPTYNVNGTNAPDGLVIDLLFLDNNFNVQINGVWIAGSELGFDDVPGNGSVDGWSETRFVSDRKSHGSPGIGVIWQLSADPLIRVRVSPNGKVTLLGRRCNTCALEPMEIKGDRPQFNTIPYNLTGNNTVVLSQSGAPSVGPTHAYWRLSGVNHATADTDGDGIPNRRDIDSDADGCFDARESGGVDANNNGVLDGTGISTQGLVTGGSGGYDGITGNELTNHKFNLSLASVVVNPASISARIELSATVQSATTFTGGVPNYNTASTTGITYQWYDGNPASGGVALTNSGVYSGVTGSTLYISNTSGLSGKQYYVIVSHTNIVCSETRSATLTVVDPCTVGAIVGTPTANDPDGDGINNACDFDDDNDGILDIDEQGASITTNMRTPTQGVILSHPSNVTWGAHPWNGNGIYGVFDEWDGYGVAPGGTLSNNEWMRVTFPTPIIMTYWETAHICWAPTFSLSSVYKIQASNDGTNWTDLTPNLTWKQNMSGVYGCSNIDEFTNNRMAYKHYRYYGISGAAGGGFANEFVFKHTEIGTKAVVDAVSSSFSYINSGNLAGVNDPYISGATGWSGASNTSTNQFVGMMFPRPFKILGVSTKGRGDADEWVGSYELLATKDGTNWVSIGIFGGNGDRNSVAYRRVSDADITWTGARIRPLSWNGRPSLRFQFDVGNPDGVNTDGDGMVDRLDLDSDGDGCFDAIEGGASFNNTNLVSGRLSGGVNQLGVPTLATDRGQSIGYSINSSFNACTDTDNDGTPDVDDLDDDNDGITDANEKNCTATNLDPNPLSLNYVDSGSWTGNHNNPLLNGTVNPACWAGGSGTSTTQFVGMKFEGPFKITGVRTQGRGDAAQWLLTYELEGTKDGVNWVSMGTFTGNTDQNTVIYRSVSNTEADWRGVRIRPLTWNGHPSFRFQFELCNPVDRDTDGDGIVDRLDPN